MPHPNQVVFLSKHNQTANVQQSTSTPVAGTLQGSCDLGTVMYLVFRVRFEHVLALNVSICRCRHFLFSCISELPLNQVV